MANAGRTEYAWLFMVKDHIKAHAKLGAMIAPEIGYCLVFDHHPDGSHIVRTLVTDPINGT